MCQIRNPNIPRPEKEFKGFARIELEPGETKKIKMAMEDRVFAYYVPHLGIYEIDYRESSHVPYVWRNKAERFAGSIGIYSDSKRTRNFFSTDAQKCCVR